MDTTRHEGRARRFTRPAWMLIAFASLVLLVTILVIFGEDTVPTELRGGGHESALDAPEPEGVAATRRARVDAAPEAQELVLIGPLEAGTYSLRLDIEGWAPEVHEVQIVGGETCRFAVSGTAAPRPDDMETWRMQKSIASMIRRQQTR